MPEPSHYYYGPDGERVELQPADDTLAIAYRDALPDRDIERAIRSDDELRPFMLSPELSVRRTTLFKRSPAAAASLEAFAERVNASDRVAFVAQTYRRGSQRMVVTDEFVAKFKETVSRDQIDAWLNSNGAEIIETLDFTPNTFLLRVIQPDLRGAIDVANRCFESGLVEYAQPNFIKVQQRRAFTPNDPFFPQQWHLPRVAAEDAWDITRGDPNVIVAILDDSVDIDHEDFAAAGKIVAPFDFLQNDADPRPASSNDFHGTPVAGVAVADGNNSVGVSGMAPNCRLMPIRLVGSAQSDTTEANAFRHAVDNGAHIISNSWGPPDNGGPGPLPAIVGSAFDHALTVGRGGLGCIILFAAGNGNESISSAATLDGYASDNRVTAVGAVNDVNTRSGYSDFGLEVDVCAPSDGSTSGAWTGIPPDGSTLAIFTTDRSGTAGLNNADPFTGVVETAGGAVNYTGTFGGTSSACPLAAGVAALIVSIAPDLTRDQVVYVLEATADKVDFANTDPVGQYQANGHSQFYGFGRVNAHQAVRGGRSSVAERDFVQSVQVTMRRTAGDRFVSVNELEAVDARRRPTDAPTVSFIRSGPDGFLRAEHGGAVDEVEVDSLMLTPAYSVVLGDRKIDTTDDPQASTVVELFVEKRMDGAADHALIVLGNVGGLDPERGDQGAVELGYEESTALTPVLAGSVVSIDRSLNQQRVLVYSAISTLARTYSDRTFEEMRAGEIVSELADGAGVPTAEIEDGTLYPAYVADSQRSALWHIRELARLNGFDVYVDSGGELHFHQFAGSLNKHVFDYGRHIVELQVLDSPDHAEQVDFRGESPGAGSGDQSWAWLAKSSEGSWASAGDGEPIARVESSAIRTGAGARTAADAALQTIRRAAVKGRLLTFGSPQIELGDALQVRNAPLEELNAVYQVRAVKHRIVKAGGFTTEIELGGIE